MKLDKFNEKQARDSISFLKNKLESKFVEFQKIDSYVNTWGMAYLAAIIGFVIPIMVKGFLVWGSLSVLILTTIWILFNFHYFKQLRATNKRIFQIGSLIKGIYKHNLNLDVEEVERVLNNMPKQTKEGIKEYKNKINEISNEMGDFFG